VARRNALVDASRLKRRRIAANWVCPNEKLADIIAIDSLDQSGRSEICRLIPGVHRSGARILRRIYVDSRLPATKLRASFWTNDRKQDQVVMPLARSDMSRPGPRR